MRQNGKLHLHGNVTGIFQRITAQRASKDLLTVEGNYTFHFQASYGDKCTATRELLWSVRVDPGADPSRTVVMVNVSGRKGTITVVPKDNYGNNLGPGHGDGFTVTGVPGTTVTGPVKDTQSQLERTAAGNGKSCFWSP